MVVERGRRGECDGEYLSVDEYGRREVRRRILNERRESGKRGN